MRFKRNRYNTHRFAIRAISVFRVKFNVEFTRQAVAFSIELFFVVALFLVFYYCTHRILT